MPSTVLHLDAPGAATADVAGCRHCGLPVPPGLCDGSPMRFCCRGCEVAYEVIHSCGLDRYYTLLRLAADSPKPRRTLRRTYAEFDDPAFTSLYCRSLADGMKCVELLLEGVHCSACVWLLENLPRVVPGVAEARLDIRRSSVEVTYRPEEVALSRIGRSLENLGYPPHPARSAGAREAQRSADRRMLVRIAVAGACAGNIMLLFFALYAGMFEGMDRGHELILRWIAMALNTLCLLWPGAVFGRSALAALRTRTIHLDVPIALGLYLGGLWGIWKVVAATWTGAAAGAGDIYFDSISALIFFLLVGRFLQQRQQRATADALELLFSVAPAFARRVQDANPAGDGGDAVEVPTEALRVGDVVEILPGDAIPADGVVLSGRSSCDVSILTGESAPVAAMPGVSVAAGSVNVESVLRIRVAATGQQTRIGRLMHMVEDASRRRAAIVRLADRWGKWLLWVLLTLAAVTLVLWWRTGPANAIDHAVALLIATCPCGLGLATPLAMTVAIGRAARRGILIKGGDALQSLADSRRGAVVLDKTGTITQGRLALCEWTGDDRTRVLAAALESTSSHPAARALARDLQTTSRREAAPDPHVDDAVQHPGAGIEGTVEGCRLRIGSRAFLETAEVSFTAAVEDAETRALAQGRSPVYVAVDGRCTGLAALADPVRPDAAAAIRAMRSRGWRVSILSGDHPDVVTSVARVAGVEPGDCRGGVSPEQKLALIADMARKGPVVMVGDGVNDAAALAAATVGIAVRGGAEASLNAADIAMSREGLAPVVEAIDGGRRTMRSIHLTIATSLVYNAVAASLSIAGMITPLLAAIIMPASSLTVVAICLRSRAFRSRSTLAAQRARTDAPRTSPISLAPSARERLA